jgi:hypothetical protein
MMPITRRELEIVLDQPGQRDYVVSAYADLTIKDGFDNFVDVQMRNLARAAQEALARVPARKGLNENLELVRRAVAAHDPSAKGLAVFASASRGLNKSIHLEFPVETRIVVDEEPFILPLLEHWHGEPIYLVALVDSDRARLFEAHAGAVEEVRNFEREDLVEPIERDKPRFTYKKRFAATHHERLHGMDEDKFLQNVADLIDDHWERYGGRFAGILLLGQAPITSTLVRLLPRDLRQAVVEQAPQFMTSRPHNVADDVARVMKRWHSERDDQFRREVSARWKTQYRVANGPSDVLDALQQGRAAQVLIGSRRDIEGSRCEGCGYRLGAVVRSCPYCQGHCRTVNIVQEVLRMALRHRVAVHLFRALPKDDPLQRVGGLSALLHAEANWAPDRELAEASQGHGQLS